jgi:hypothetical protein
MYDLEFDPTKGSLSRVKWLNQMVDQPDLAGCFTAFGSLSTFNTRSCSDSRHLWRLHACMSFFDKLGMEVGTL